MGAKMVEITYKEADLARVAAVAEAELAKLKDGPSIGKTEAETVKNWILQMVRRKVFIHEKETARAAAEKEVVKCITLGS